MNRSLYGIKTQLSALPKEGQEEFLKLFVPEESAALEKISPLDPAKLRENFLHFIHPSWIEQLSIHYSKEDLPFFLSILTPLQQQHFQGITQLPKLTRSAHDFLSQSLHLYFLKNLDPIAVSCREALSEFLFLPAPTIDQLPLFLGSFDLKLELPLIINGAQLKALYTCLPKHLCEFLRIISPSKVSFKKLGISSWDGQQHSLIDSLEQRGYEKITKIFSNHSQSFQRYLMYRFDRSKEPILNQRILASETEQTSLQHDLKTSIEYLSKHEV